MTALALTCTLKRCPDESNTAALAKVVLDAVSANDVETEMVRVADHSVEPGVISEPVTDDDEYLTSRETDWSNTTGQTAAQNLLAVGGV